MNWLDSWTGHSLSLGAIFAAFSGVAPPIAALASAVWFAIQIYESRTYRRWSHDRKMRSVAKRLARLKAKEKITLAEIAALERVRHARAEANDIVAEAKAEAAALLVHETVKAIETPIAAA